MIQFDELRYLGFRHFLPHPALRPWVQCYWSVSHPTLVSGSREYLYPDGGCSLNFDLISPGPWQTTFDASQVTRSVYFQERCDSFGIRFHPGAAFQLFRLPIGELGGGTFAASDIGLTGIEEFYEELLNADDTKRARLADAWLCGYAAKTNCHTGMIEKLIPQFAQAETSITEALHDIGASRRTVERLFRERVGVSPGQFKTWSRARLARQLIKSQPTTSLAQIGVTCGYHDQSHFIRQFEHVTSFTPGRYRERQMARRLAAGT